MRQRLLTTALGLPILFAVLFYFDTVALNFAIAIIAVVGVHEVLMACGATQYKVLSGSCMLFSFMIPFFRIPWVNMILPLVCFALAVVLFVTLLKNHNTMRAEQTGFIFFISLVIPFALSTAIYLRDFQGVATGLFYVIYALAAAWLADAGGYFFGMFFGKRKLVPNISPKKTVEGAIGGFLMGLLIAAVYPFLFNIFSTNVLGVAVEANPLYMLLTAPFLTLVSIIGDLSASVIKRQYGIKDFGSIMPGHGGVMDRFDSVLFVLPLVYIFSQLLPYITIVG